MARKREKRTNVVPPQRRYSIKQFQAEFPTEEACLDYLRDRLYPDGIYCPKCKRVTKHHRVLARKSYSCQFCGHHVHPTAGTIFHKSSTELRTWFHAIFLMSQTRCGTSAKELQRQTGVTYKTAWRMFNRIRTMLMDDDGGEPLGGGGVPVEADETYIGGKPRYNLGQHAPRWANKIGVFGAVQRGGRLVAHVLPKDGPSNAILSTFNTRLMPGSIVYTDESSLYRRIHREGYQHYTINHSARVYVDGDVHTNTIENVFSIIKTGIRGVYKRVSEKHLQGYLNEYVFRYNHREDDVPMFRLVLANVSKAA